MGDTNDIPSNGLEQMYSAAMPMGAHASETAQLKTDADQIRSYTDGKVDSDFVTDTEHFMSMSHEEIYAKAQSLDASAINSTATAWSDLSSALGTMPFGIAFLQSHISQTMKGDAADAAYAAVGKFGQSLSDVGQSFEAVSVKLQAFGYAAQDAKASVPPPIPPTVMVMPQMQAAAAEEAENARKNAARAMEAIYSPEVLLAGQNVPALPAPINPVSGSAPGAVGGGLPGAGAGGGLSSIDLNNSVHAAAADGGANNQGGNGSGGDGSGSNGLGQQSTNGASAGAPAGSMGGQGLGGPSGYDQPLTSAASAAGDDGFGGSDRFRSGGGAGAAGVAGALGAMGPGGGSLGGDDEHLGGLLPGGGMAGKNKADKAIDNAEEGRSLGKTAARTSMTGMGAPRGADHGDDDTEHQVASYLISAGNGNALIGELPKVVPPVIGVFEE